ncbi:hypothetical protein PHEL49_0722 [Polaribacter sp. Hel1_33_49]|nr:hypothetical protein PHEL49_0722 [Polaribacter sp. Hel1_33_49]
MKLNHIRFSFYLILLIALKAKYKYEQTSKTYSTTSTNF